MVFSSEVSTQPAPGEVELDVSPVLGQSSPPGFRCGTIAVVGCPNVGKSTLMNALIGEKLSITSDKPQTTRLPVCGITTRQAAQFIFVDTPGYQKRHLNPLNRSLNDSVISHLKSVDVILWVVAQGRFGSMDEAVLRLLPSNLPVVLVINKIDLAPGRDAVFTFSQSLVGKLSVWAQHSSGPSFTRLEDFAAVVPVSAYKKIQIDTLLQVIAPLLPEAPAVYDADTLTTSSSRNLSEDIVREKIFRLMQAEVPYVCDVKVDSFVETTTSKGEPLFRISASILVSRPQHKPMLLGENGETIKRISQGARVDMERLFGVKVALNTWVKVEK